jgi:hypothetical protein
VQVRNAGDERLKDNGTVLERLKDTVLERLKDNGTVLATTWPSSPCSSLAKMPSSVSS